MDEFTPVMISPKQLFSLFIVQGVENLYDEELAEQLGTSIVSLNMMREAKFTGISMPPWLALNVHRVLSEKGADVKIMDRFFRHRKVPLHRKIFKTQISA